MTLEARKAAFKGSWTVGIPTLVLCWIICWFFNASWAAKDVTFLSFAQASGVSCFITPLICGLISYPITASVFKKKVAEKMAHPEVESAPSPSAGELEQQLIFFRWMPQNWLVYTLVFALLGAIVWGCGIPTLFYLFCPGTLAAAGTGSRILVTAVGGFQIAASAQYGAYLSHIYYVKMLQNKLVASMAK